MLTHESGYSAHGLNPRAGRTDVRRSSRYFTSLRQRVRRVGRADSRRRRRARRVAPAQRVDDRRRLARAEHLFNSALAQLADEPNLSRTESDERPAELFERVAHDGDAPRLVAEQARA